MPRNPSDLAKKLSAVISDKAVTEAEKLNASRRLGELLAKHPDILNQGTKGKDRPKTQQKPPKAPKPPKPTGFHDTQVRTADDLAAAIGISTKDLRRAVRVAGKAGQHLGMNGVRLGAAAILDLLDEWER